MDARSMGDSEGTKQFGVLTICTGNICRSPVAERLLAAGLGPEVSVGSAGTGAVVGHPIADGMLPHLGANGISADGFSARQLDARLVRSADLVLALTAEHRARAVWMTPAALRRSFTLLEFARIVSAPEFPALTQTTVAGRLREMTELARSRRRLGDQSAGDDVPDPYGRGAEEYDSAFRMIQSAAGLIVSAARP